MRAMQVALPTKDDLGGVDGGGAVTAGAQRLNSWLNGNKTWPSSYPTGPQQGWRRIDINDPADLNLMLSYAKAGKPVLASTSDHIAVIRPDQDVSWLTTSNLGSLVIAQAGAKNLNRGHLSDVDGWRSIGYQNVQYFVKENLTVLQNNVPVSFLSGDQDSKQYFRIALPQGCSRVTIQIYGGSGDCDLYVKRGNMPTRSSWDYRPYLYGNNETVTVSYPTSGDWYIMLDGYSAYSGVTLRVSYY